MTLIIFWSFQKNSKSITNSSKDLPRFQDLIQAISRFCFGSTDIREITYGNFECSGNIDNGETRECTVEDYIVSLDEVPINGDSSIVSNMNNLQQHLYTNDISNTENKIKTSLSLTTAPFITGVPTH